jgi:putative phosphoesterase
VQLGVFSDVHGNAKALQAIWEALATRSLTDGPVLNAGDNVGYGDAPEACIEFLRERPNIVCVRGNYDRSVAKFLTHQEEYQAKWSKSRPEKFAAIARDSDAISDTSRDWLRELPSERELTLNGTKLLLTHYAPGVKEGLGTWTTDERLRELAEATDAQVVVCGHTHTPFVRRVGGVLWVNPGTVGRGWGRRAAYAILTLNPEAPPDAQLHQVLIQ